MTMVVVNCQMVRLISMGVIAVTVGDCWIPVQIVVDGVCVAFRAFNFLTCRRAPYAGILLRTERLRTTCR